MNNLKKIIEEKGVQVARMSRETGYRSPTIYHWISEHTIPNLYAARDIAQYLGVTDRDIWQ